MQTNKQKIVWQQLQTTATELREDFFKVYLPIFCYFILIFN